MRRTTIKISEELDARLRHEAARRGVTVSELTRDAIESYLAPPGLSFVNLGDSGRSDISERIEEILREELPR